MTHQEIEIEFKNLLTFDEFTSLCSAFKVNPENFFEQTNHYFDTPDFSLKNKGCALRVRIKGDNYTLTLKQPADEGLLETHQVISEEEYSLLKNKTGLINGKIHTILTNELGVSPAHIEYVGSLTTNRIEFPYQDGLLVLDESHYLETSDFELEYEVKNFDRGKEIFLELLNAYGIPQRQTKNKIIRFYEAKASAKAEDGEPK
ncbi:CYTH domain-containing protein [Sutcliffiella rhizosphaerae]|uniref:Triphosphatase YjbK n=1 Tax=Sutcliffiella rhizosphaerae TaxID=2880967 RepID=A0ABM8YSR2_9BACI|nr:CYTH domain-containing protein [Sutcliffiella rhizosphaerae]CAG9622832.1 Putative triphosphatase YjbK [Sutcliffiella rhizosphaerae]